MKEILQNEQMIRQKLTEALQKENEAFWLKRLEERNMGRLHVAVMTEPYFSLVLAGKKTMESRFSQRKIAPWGKVAAGDTVILKKSGGGYAGIFEAGSVQFLQPKNRTDVLAIRAAWNDRLCIEDGFWQAKADSRYVTLIGIINLCSFEKFFLPCSNRQAWISYR